jgi:3-hydroxybutyrate dehydrogenase
MLEVDHYRFQADRARRMADRVTDDLVREKQPMLDYTTPEKIGALAVFLCGDAASTITGAALSIDGGWVAQ